MTKRQAGPPDVEFTAALAVAEGALRGVLGDREAWAAEAANQAAEPLPWPLQAQGEGYPQLLRILAAVAVQSTLQAIHEADGHAIEPDAAGGDFQIILRVVNRAVQAADAAMCRAFGAPRGAHRLTGKQKFHNWLKRRDVETAVMSGLPRKEALEGLSISPAAAYRAMKRR